MVSSGIPDHVIISFYLLSHPSLLPLKKKKEKKGVFFESKRRITKKKPGNLAEQNDTLLLGDKIGRNKYFNWDLYATLYVNLTSIVLH